MSSPSETIPPDVNDTAAAWDRIASGYDAFVTPTHMWLAEQGLARADVGAGMRLLDVAAGTGALTLPALGAGAHVMAVDVSPAMVQALEERARRAGLAGLDTAVMDGHALDLPDDAFDVTASQFGVMLFPDLPRGLREMARVTRQGGRVLVLAYGPPAEVEFIQFFMQALTAVVPDFPGLPMDPPPLPFQVADPRKLEAELERAGLNEVRVETVTEQLRFESGRRLWDWLMNSNPIPATLIANLDASRQEEARLGLERLVRERAAGEPTAVLTNPVHIAVATK